MNTKIVIQILIGFVFGVLATMLGCVLYLELFTNYSFFSDYSIIVKSGNLGRIIAIGSLVNLALFAILIRKHQDLKARGSVLAVIVLTLLTLFF